MAQIAPLATLLGAGVTIFGAARQSQAQSAAGRQAREQEAARAAALSAQQASEKRLREARLAGTTAAARARLASGGVLPDEGSALALTSGLAHDASAAQADSDQVFAARLSAGRRSLLNDDGSLTPWLRAGTSFGGSLRSLLD
jgi:hypothetical protein